MSSETKNNKKINAGTNKSGIIEVSKAVIIALIICLLLILLAAFLVNVFNINDNVLTIINQVIKILSILIGCLVAFRTRSDGWLKGIITGIIFVGLAFVMFSLLDGEWSISLSFLTDIAFGAVAGLISGIIAVNIRK